MGLIYCERSFPSFLKSKEKLKKYFKEFEDNTVLEESKNSNENDDNLALKNDEVSMNEFKSNDLPETLLDKRNNEYEVYKKKVEKKFKPIVFDGYTADVNIVLFKSNVNFNKIFNF